ncbi:hypothetical protein Bwad002_18310 [Bilophila wadsworthia]
MRQDRFNIPHRHHHHNNNSARSGGGSGGGWSGGSGALNINIIIPDVGLGALNFKGSKTVPAHVMYMGRFSPLESAYSTA